MYTAAGSNVYYPDRSLFVAAHDAADARLIADELNRARP